MSVESSQREPKRRKVRKGTHSCWECRRRKTRCVFSRPDDDVCVGCRDRSTNCLSQEFSDGNTGPPAPSGTGTGSQGQSGDRRLTQRMRRLEEMMEGLVQTLAPLRSGDGTLGLPVVSAHDAPGQRGGEVASTGTGSEPPQQQHASSLSSSSSSPYDDQSPEPDAGDILMGGGHGETPMGAMFGIRDALIHAPSPIPPPQSILIPNSLYGVRAATAAAGKHRFYISPEHIKASEALYDLFPHPEDVAAIIRSSAGSMILTALLYSHQDIKEGIREPQAAMASIPPRSSHPAVLARRLLQLMACCQYFAPVFAGRLRHLSASCASASGAGSSLRAMRAATVAAVARILGTDDDLVGSSVEGLQCLVLLAMYQMNAGKLRRAWMTTRRAMGVAQMMGIDRGGGGGGGSRGRSSLRSVDPDSRPEIVPSDAMLWFRIVMFDRCLSLFLGLPLGTYDDAGFAGPRTSARDSPMERLEKAQTVAARRLAERNGMAAGKGGGDYNTTSPSSPSSSSAAAAAGAHYTLTQSIDHDLETAARRMDASWWEAPRLDVFAPGLLSKMMQLLLQIQHFTLLILLHLPYLLRGGYGGRRLQQHPVPEERRYRYSRAACSRAARGVMRRFIVYRGLSDSTSACRHVDYAGFLGAMTLLLGYLNVWTKAPSSSCRRGLLEEDEDEDEDDDGEEDHGGEEGRQEDDDRRLAEAVRDRMRALAVANEDKLSAASADMIDQLLPIIGGRDGGEDGTAAAAAVGEEEGPLVRFDVPYLGTVEIRPSAARAAKIAIRRCFPDGTSAPSRDRYGAAAAAAAAAAGSALSGRDWQPGQGQRVADAPNANTNAPFQTPFSLYQPSVNGGFDGFGVHGTTEQAEAYLVGQVQGQGMMMGPPPPPPPQEGEETGAGGHLDGLGRPAEDGPFAASLPLLFPDVMADTGEWAFQGLDTTFWSLLNEGMNVA